MNDIYIHMNLQIFLVRETYTFHGTISTTQSTSYTLHYIRKDSQATFEKEYSPQNDL